MTRAVAKIAVNEIADVFVNAIGKRSFQEELPVIKRFRWQGEDVDVEIDVLENTPEYINLVFSISAGKIGTYFPVSANRVVRYDSKVM